MIYHSEIRKSGYVSRYHCHRTIGVQTLAQHGWGVAVILMDLWDRMADGIERENRVNHGLPSAELLAAALLHDSAELRTGDTPATAKWDHPFLKAVLDTAEEQYAKEMGIHEILYTALSPIEYSALKAADMLDLVHYTWEEAELGNTTVLGITHAGVRFLELDWKTSGDHMHLRSAVMAHLYELLDSNPNHPYVRQYRQKEQTDHA